MTRPLRALSSKATAPVLTGLAGSLDGLTGIAVRFESAGGVEVARRVREGEEADLLVLADDVMRALDDEGLLVTGSLRPLFLSEVVLGVRDDAPVPPLETVDDLVALLRRARSVGYSTGPSGTALVRRLEGWGLADEVGPRLVRAQPGVPVGRLVAEGRAEVGVQQRSELTGVPGVRVVGPLPGDAAVTSTFSGAVLRSSDRPAEAERVLGALAAPDVATRVRANGMEPAPPPA